LLSNLSTTSKLGWKLAKNSLGQSRLDISDQKLL